MFSSQFYNDIRVTIEMMRTMNDIILSLLYWALALFGSSTITTSVGVGVGVWDSVVMAVVAIVVCETDNVSFAVIVLLVLAAMTTVSCGIINEKISPEGIVMAGSFWRICWTESCNKKSLIGLPAR